MTTEYGSRSAARRAAKRLGLDPDIITESDGKFMLPTSDTSTPESTSANEPTPAQQVEAAIASVPAGEMPPLPPFLKVENRKRLDATGEARVKALLGRRSDDPNAGRVDHRKPQSMSWMEFDAYQAAAEAKKKTAALERIADMKAKHPELATDKPKRAKRPTVAEQLNGAKIRVVSKTNPYRDNSAGHVVFTMYKDGMTIPAFEKKAAGKTGSRKPVDMLMHDVRKGHVALDKKEAK